MIKIFDGRGFRGGKSDMTLEYFKAYLSDGDRKKAESDLLTCGTAVTRVVEGKHTYVPLSSLRGLNCTELTIDEGLDYDT
jgi:hypothetical protein